jgi:hypothetical protein
LMSSKLNGIWSNKKCARSRTKSELSDERSPERSEGPPSERGGTEELQPSSESSHEITRLSRLYRQINEPQPSSESRRRRAAACNTMAFTTATYYCPGS